MLSELPIRSVSFPFSTSRYLRFRSRVLTASRGVTYRRASLPVGQNDETFSMLTRLPARLLHQAVLVARLTACSRDWLWRLPQDVGSSTADWLRTGEPPGQRPMQADGCGVGCGPDDVAVGADQYGVGTGEAR
jgi:hypothetical protein